ncbi:SDR family NAD(P)-dependent oxidoreductase [Nonomuraea sp. MG754425]|uniref:SDR family NAD(P)-dependent oxidoreductase n=1 Tax=Nonomuraea sp. MG754425 TaxID=2570319 RepID=UPI001F3CDB21|nr:SDR family NAD(P)-dependent oxidoreductase [Nonomuraea sp. MG754425]MCF6469739.1 SDR family NAD(P)-dependent oxidoreductase [Nonomuraea sp. MG754425]
MRTILITGATAGLGQELARRLADAGDLVIVHGRDPGRVRKARERAGGRTEGVVADLSELRQVERMAEEVLDRFDRLDVLVNNAGIGAGRPLSGREESADGIELRLAVNYLAGYHLTRRLTPLLVASAPARVVNVASAGQQAIDFGDPVLARGYSRMRGYAQSKLAQIMFTFDLAEELSGQGVTVNALHPATFMNTSMVREALVPPISSVGQGATATMRLIDELDGVTGRYFDQQSESRAAAQAYDLEARKRLRHLSDELVRRALD